jgi:hypothetical protein
MTTQQAEQIQKRAKLATDAARARREKASRERLQKIKAHLLRNEEIRKGGGVRKVQ